MTRRPSRLVAGHDLGAAAQRPAGRAALERAAADQLVVGVVAEDGERLGQRLVAAIAGRLVAAYAIADRIEFSIGTGYAVPTQLVFVPMLLLLPTRLVPLLVDTLLFPIGPLAALAAGGAPAGALLVLALVPLLVGFGREREASIERSLELGRAYRGTALLLRDLLEEDDEYTRPPHRGRRRAVGEGRGRDGGRRGRGRETEMGALLQDIGKIARRRDHQ